LPTILQKNSISIYVNELFDIKTIDSTNVVNSGGVSEEQYILITGDPFTAFTLQFDGVNTGRSL